MSAQLITECEWYFNLATKKELITDDNIYLENWIDLMTRMKKQQLLYLSEMMWKPI